MGRKNSRKNKNKNRNANFSKKYVKGVKKDSKKENNDAEKNVAAENVAAENAAAENAPSEKDKKEKKVKKSTAKAIGVKSVFKLEGENEVITTFGKGNQAKINSIIKSHVIEPYEGNTKVNVEYLSEDKKYEVYGNLGVEKRTYLPVNEGETRKDLIGLKKQLEEVVFLKYADENHQEGQHFNDNIRIQIAYSIFDIIKVLVPISAQLIYTVNGLDRHNDKEDAIGYYLNYSVPYENFGAVKENSSEKAKFKILEKRNKYEKFVSKAKENFIYFKDVFYEEKPAQLNNGQKTNKKSQVEYQLKSDEEIYYILNCLNFLRNNIAHFKISNQNDGNAIFRDCYYDQGAPKNLFNKGMYQVIDSAYGKAVDKINKSSVKYEDKNLYLLAKALGFAESKYSERHKELAQLIFKTSILKSNSNRGYSIKKIRELLFEKNILTISDDEKTVNTYRAKLYKILDLVLTYYLSSSEYENMIEEFIDQLRGNQYEEEKQESYANFTEKISEIDEIRIALKRVVSLFEGKEYANKNVIKLKEEWIDECKINKNVSDFTKLIYFISRFLSGKEINILLTQCISKLQNIDAFNKTVEELVEKGILEMHHYKRDYSLFERSGEIAKELEIVKSISKMDRSFDHYPLEKLYKDFLLTLGVKESNKNDSENNIEDENSLEYCYEKYFSKDSKTKLSAFIKNSVINSQRFLYVVKYVKPKDVNAIMKNPSVVYYVLQQMTEAQIERYCKTIGIDIAFELKKKRKDLLKMLIDIDFSKIRGNRSLQNKKNRGELNRNDAIEREKKKALLGLYYTVAYIFLKNMVNANGRYILAFYCLERDKILYKEAFAKQLSTIEKSKKWSTREFYDTLTRLFTGKLNLDCQSVPLLSEKASEKLDRYIYEEPKGKSEGEKDGGDWSGYSNINDRIYVFYRNTVEHLNLIGNIGRYLEFYENVAMDCYSYDVAIGSKTKEDIKMSRVYFSFYHHMMQKMFFEEYKASKNRLINKSNNRSHIKSEKKINKDFDKMYVLAYEKLCKISKIDFDGEYLKGYKYSKALLRSVNIPFGYNLARYKNLSYVKYYSY